MVTEQSKLHNTTMYSYHVYFKVNALFKIFATDCTLKFWLNTAFKLQMPRDTTSMFIFPTTFIWTIYVNFTFI